VIVSSIRSPVTYRARLKGGKTKWKELPPPEWTAILQYLHVSRRQLEDETPVFTATVNNGEYLRRYYSVPSPSQLRPISGHAINQALKRYCKRAGLNPANISLHSLRHLGAELFQQASGDVVQTQKFLDHAHLNTTQVYLTQLSGEDHQHWQAMVNKLGVG
jgi:integrase